MYWGKSVVCGLKEVIIWIYAYYSISYQNDGLIKIPTNFTECTFYRTHDWQVDTSAVIIKFFSLLFLLIGHNIKFDDDSTVFWWIIYIAASLKLICWCINIHIYLYYHIYAIAFHLTWKCFVWLLLEVTLLTHLLHLLRRLEDGISYVCILFPEADDEWWWCGMGCFKPDVSLRFYMSALVNSINA